MTTQSIKLRWLATGALISDLGMSFIWPLTSVYLHNQLHISLTTIGIVLLLNSLTGIIGSYAGGVLYDRGNPYKLLLGGITGSLLILIALTFSHGWPLFGFWLALLGFCSGWNVALTNASATSIRDMNSNRVFNLLYLFQNLGIVLGTALVGYLYDISITLLFVTAAVLFVGYLIIVAITYRSLNRTPQPHEHAHHDNHSTRLPAANRIILLTLFASLVIVWLMYQQWASNVSVYMTDLGLPLIKYSFLWTLNASGIVVIQIILNLLQRFTNNPRNQVLFGLAMLALSFLVLAGAKHYVSFVVAMLLLTLGEATAFPMISVMVNQLSPFSVKGRSQGLVNASASAGRALGPLVGGAVIEATSYPFLFKIAVGVYLLVIVLVVVTLGLYRHQVKTYD